MKDKPTKKDIDEILELVDKAPKFDGNVDWKNTNHFEMSGIDNDANWTNWLRDFSWCFSSDFSPEIPYKTEEGCQLGEIMNLAAQTPKMAQIIRHQQELLEKAYLMIKNVDFCLEKDCVDMMRSYKTTELLKKLQPMLTNKGEE